MKRRILSLLLAVCTAVSLLALPAGAATSGTVTFSDVSDRDTAMAVESLRLMGVLDGYGDGTFRPGTSLTRAQFCKMAVYAMNGEDELGRYSTVTVFPDVKPSYWASSYINMAAKGKGIIAGYADGQFHPDRTVTVGQAVTILLRLLGYKDENLGGIWPQSYMAEAASIGMTDGVSTNAYAALTRAQAARLFLNLLRADTVEGGAYAATLGTVVDKVMLVSSTAKAPDGRENGLETAGGNIYQLASGKTSNGMLNGYKGTMVLDKQGKALTFVPDAVGSSKVITLSVAKATEITDITGTRYTLTSDTSTYYNGKETTWGDTYSWLNAGASVTLYLGAAGNVEYVFVGGGSTASAAVVVYEDHSAAGFDSLVGTGTAYTIYKNGVKASSADLRKYDVATYSSVTNTIRVCDTRISGYYEACSPNASEPSKVTVLGHEFDVLSTAMESLSAFKPGDQIILLLTEDNQVAGAVKPGTGGAGGNAVGIVKSASAGSASVDLLCGIHVEGKANISDTTAAQLQGQLARVSSTKDGLNVSSLTGGVGGDLDVNAKKLGGQRLADNVMIFRRDGGALTSVSLSQLTSGIISKSQIAYARTNWAGEVDLIVLGSADSSTVYYGRAIVQTSDDTRTLAVEYGNGQRSEAIRTDSEVSHGTYIYMGVKGGQITSLGTLTRLAGVSNSAWSGDGAVTVAGRTYTVSDNVVCYNRTTDTWMTLSAAHAYAKEANLYVRDGVVRVIEVS